MSQQDRYGYGYGYGDYGRAYYRGRRRPRSPFGDIKLAALGKMYADVPVDAVTKAMEGLNLNYKENRDMLDKYKSALAQAKVMAGDEPEKQRIIKDIQSRVDSFIEDTGGAFETGDDFIRGVANDVISNPWLAQSITNREKFDEDQKLLDQMRMQGLAPMYLADPNFTTMGPEGQNRQYTSFISSEVNRRPALEAFFKNLKANKRADYNNLLDVFTSQGISDKRIDQVVAGALPLLQETKEYRQSLENEKQRAQYEGRPFDLETFNKNWLSQLEQVGREFVYNQNDMNLNRSASRFSGNDNNNLNIQTTSVEDFGAGMIGGVERDALILGNTSRYTNDQFSFYSENTKKDPTFVDQDPTQQRLLGSVIDLTDATGNLFSGQRGEFHNRPSNQTFNARRTGNVYSVPVIVDFNKNGVYGNNSGAIAKAFKDQLGLTWNPDDQADNAGQLPHSGATGGFALPGRSGGRFDRNFTSFEPRSMQVGNYTINYMMPKEGGSPIVVEMLPKMEYEVYDVTGETSQGMVLGDMSPQTAAHFKVNPDIRWTSYKQDQGVVDKVQTNIRLNNTINQLSRVPGLEGIVKDLQSIQANVNATGQLDENSIAILNQIDRTLMPQVLRKTNANIAKPKGELSSKKTN